MNNYGAQNMIAPLERVVVRAPSPGMASADADLWHYGDQLDQAVLESEHREFVKSLSANGAEIVRLNEAPDSLYDAVFTHDPSLVTNHGAILLRMGKTLRSGEVDAHAALYTRLGIPVLGSIESPGMVEGGDCLWLDNNTLVVGRGFRTNQEGINQLAEILRGTDVEVFAFDLPVYYGGDACLHLMSLISLLDSDLALVRKPLLPVALYLLLRARGVEMIDAPEAEFTASNTLSINVLALGPRHGIMLAGLPETRAVMENAGCRIDTFPGDTLCIKCEGGPTCLTRPLLRA